MCQWENNTRDLKTSYTIKLADFFNTTCDYILDGVKARNVEINRRIGLSDDAIDLLKGRNSLKIMIILRM